MNFGYYRFLLSSLKQQEILTSERGRKKVIEDIFSEDKLYTFKSGRGTYEFLVKIVEEKKALAIIAKKKNTKIRSSLVDGYVEKIEEDWSGSYLVINLDNEKETGLEEQSGQSIAMQHNNKVGVSPINCLRSLADEINGQIVNHGYIMSINPISNRKKDFWSVVGQHQNDIKKIVFTYAMPNIFHVAGNLEKDLRAWRDDLNVTKAEVTLENNSRNMKVNKDNLFLTESAEYSKKGGAKYKIHLRTSKKTITSDDNVVLEKFDDVEIDGLTGKDALAIFKMILEKNHDD